MSMSKKICLLGIIFIVALLVAACAEVALIGYIYLNSDEVECNMLWCTFKTTHEIRSSECYINGEMVDCDETYYERFR